MDVEWQEPHPQRLPSPDEITNNLVKIQEAKLRISELTIQIRKLEKARIAAQYDHDTRVSFIAPFRRLPEEILHEIAARCLEMKEGTKPWKLNQVNKAMRMAVNGLKGLWSTIWIKAQGSVGQWDSAVPCMNMNYLRLILERAVPAPLTVILEEQDGSQVFQELLPYENHIKKLILSESTRKRQPLRTYFSGLPDLALTSLQAIATSGENVQDFPMIRLLDMAVHSARTDIALHLSMCNLTEAPRLIEHPVMQKVAKLVIRFTQRQSASTAPQPDFSIPLLETLVIHGNLNLLSYKMPIIKVLKVSNVSHTIARLHPHHLPPTLEGLHLENLGFSTRVGSSDLQELANLTCLTIQKINCNQPTCQWFNLPNLEEFTLSNLNYYPNQTPSVSIIGQGGMFGHLPSLKRLWVDDLRILFLEDFQSCPNLIALRVTSCSTAIHLFDYLINDPTSVPRLEEFLFQPDWSNTFAFRTALQDCASKRPGLRAITQRNQCQTPFRVGIMDSNV